MLNDYFGSNYNKADHSSGLNQHIFDMTDKSLAEKTVAYRRVPAQSVDFRDIKVINEIKQMTSLSTTNVFEDMDDDSRDSGFEDYFYNIPESSTLCFNERTINLNDSIRNQHTQLPSDEFDSVDDIEECLEYDIVSIDNDDTIPLGYTSNDSSYGAPILDEEITVSFNKSSDKIQSCSDNELDFEFD